MNQEAEKPPTSSINSSWKERWFKNVINKYTLLNIQRPWYIGKLIESWSLLSI